MRIIIFLLVLFCFSFICSNEETQVSCVFNESCVLPCSFQSGPDSVIHWIKKPEESFIHSYYYGQDQLSHQNQDFKDRTSLFVDQFSRGNASLLLREVKVQDEGTYVCVTSTSSDSSQETYINLSVFVNIVVNLEEVGCDLVCRSEEIYPEPHVTWSPAGTETNTSVSVSEKGLYSIFSSVPLSHKPPEEHSCNISTDHSWSSATYRLQPQISVLENEAIISCSVSKTPIKSLIWKFNLNEFILKRSGAEVVYNESWRQFVDAVSESGRLILFNLTSDHQGVYSCHFSSDRETHISSTRLEEGFKKETSECWGKSFAFALLVIFLMICSCAAYLGTQWLKKASKKVRTFRSGFDGNSTENTEVLNESDAGETNEPTFRRGPSNNQEID